MANKIKSLVGQNMNDCVYLNVCDRVFNLDLKKVRKLKKFKKNIKKR